MLGSETSEAFVRHQDPYFLSKYRCSIRPSYKADLFYKVVGSATPDTCQIFRNAVDHSSPCFAA